MRYMRYACLVMAISWCVSWPVQAESMDEMIGTFANDFKALKPRPNSSVNADYKLDQIALGTFYTTQAMGKLFEQNQTLLSKYDEMLMKYNEVVTQNNELIRLLSIIAKERRAEESPADETP